MHELYCPPSWNNNHKHGAKNVIDNCINEVSTILITQHILFTGKYERKGKKELKQEKRAQPKA